MNKMVTGGIQLKFLWNENLPHFRDSFSRVFVMLAPIRYG